MHDKGGGNGSLQEEIITKDTEEIPPTSNEAKRYVCIHTSNCI